MATERKLIATFCRKVNGSNIAHSMRYYARLLTAVPRAVQVLLEYGQPGDVVEIAHRDFGFQIATLKVHVGGKIDVQWTIKEGE